MAAVKDALHKISDKLHHKDGTASTHGKTVLVTGASGFVATHVLNEFLDHGYHVVGTVRSEGTAAKVRKTHSKYGDKLSFVIVEDVATPGAFDEAVRGVDGVIHTASPFVTSGITDNEKELLIPAINGTRGILASIKAHNPSVQRVVITSSFASIVDVSKGLWPEHTYTEAEWNPVTYEAGKNGPAGLAYGASKKLAEKAAWDFVEQEHPNFSISTINPPMIYGPVEQSVSDMSHLNTSAAEIYHLMDGSQTEVPPTRFWAYCDVRDVAKAHRLAYETPKAAGQRYFCTGGNFSYQMICDIIRKEIPEVKDRTPAGNVGSGLGQEVYKVDNSKAKTELGMTFIPLEKCIVDTARSLLELEKTTGKA